MKFLLPNWSFDYRTECLTYTIFEFAIYWNHVPICSCFELVSSSFTMDIRRVASRWKNQYTFDVKSGSTRTEIKLVWLIWLCPRKPLKVMSNNCKREMGLGDSPVESAPDRQFDGAILMATRIRQWLADGSIGSLTFSWSLAPSWSGHCDLRDPATLPT